MNRHALDLAHVRAMERVEKMRLKHAEKFKKEGQAQPQAQPKAQGMNNGR